MIEVDEVARPLGAPEPAFESHFPAKEWLEVELEGERRAADGALFREFTDRGWYLSRMLANLDLMNACRAKGDIDDACLHAVELGQLLAEFRLKFEWEADALRGRKLVEGAASTRIATDEDRRALIDQIMKERGKGARDAFRVAEQRRPEWGSRHAYKASFYKNPSKPSD